nr:HNH endonuclease [Mesorhizobium sp. IRAMC:0171]
MTQQRLKDVMHYDPETGLFTWRVTLSNRAKAGTTVGSDDGRGYIVIRLDKRRYYAHRLAFLYMTGEWPPHLVDHEDLNPSNNRWKNIRPATFRQNMCNQSLRSDNSLKLKGVYEQQAGKFIATIHLGGRKKKHLGTFADPQMAHDAYIKAANDTFGEFARAA